MKRTALADAIRAPARALVCVVAVIGLAPDSLAAPEFADEHRWTTDYYVHSDLLEPNFAETLARVEELVQGATHLAQVGDEGAYDTYCPVRFSYRRVLAFSPDDPDYETVSEASFHLPPGVYLYPDKRGSISTLGGEHAKVAVSESFGRKSRHWALAHELGHNAGLLHSPDVTVMVGPESTSTEGTPRTVRDYQCEAYESRAGGSQGKALCLLVDPARGHQGLDPVYPAPAWTPCSDASGYCDGRGVCVPSHPACFSAAGPAPMGTDCSLSDICAVCTGADAGCVPCGAPRNAGTGGRPVCGDGSLDDSEECDDGNYFNGDGCTVDCQWAPLDPIALSDADRDGVLDYLDNCPQEPAADQSDSDGDGVGDVCDTCPEVPNRSQEEPCGPDGDADGVIDLFDTCPDLANPTNVDRDADNVGDACDNCPGWPNRGQWDTDEDGIGDACQCGDANQDGRITTMDAYRDWFCLNQELPPESCDITIADTDRDGAFSLQDVLLVYYAAQDQLDPADFRCLRRPEGGP